MPISPSTEASVVRLSFPLGKTTGAVTREEDDDDDDCDLNHSFARSGTIPLPPEEPGIR